MNLMDFHLAPAFDMQDIQEAHTQGRYRLSGCSMCRRPDPDVSSNVPI